MGLNNRVNEEKHMRRNFGIDLLRSLSILYIVGFWHLLNYTNAISHYNNIITYRITWIVLGTFVLISGYFIGKKLNRQDNLLTFYKKRFIRIYPPYFIAIIVFAVLGLSDLTTSIKAIFSISMFVLPAPPTLWFIAMLILFYIITPLCKMISTKGFVKYLFLYISLITILFGFEYFSHLLFHYYYLDVRVAVYLAPFMTGIYIANNSIVKTNLKFITIGTVIVFTISYYFDSDNWKMNLLFSIPTVTIAPLLLFLFFSQLKFESTRIQKNIIILSTASYFMYLFHRPLYITLKKIYFPSTLSMQLLYLFVICLPIIIVVSYALQEKYNNILKSLTIRFT